MNTMRHAILTALGMLLLGGAALADEPVPVGDVVADPDAFHFRLVTLHGMVDRVTPLPPYSPTPGTTCYGSYTFLLKDETGSVEVSVLGICGRPLVRTPEVREGERIRLTAQILSPNRTTSSKKGEEKKLRVVANAIAHLAPETPAAAGGAEEKSAEQPEAEKQDNPAGDSRY
jgi:hypothetical protein